MNPHCRIGKVYSKDAKIEIIVPEPRSNFEKEIIEHAHLMNEYYPVGTMAVYAVVAIGFDGTFSSGCRIAGEACFGRTMFPVIVAEILRKKVTELAIIDALNGENME